MSADDIAARFARETADHTMTVLHNDGLYRHLAFRGQVWRPPLAQPQTTSFYWFDLITVPGTLIFQGDGESYVFSRVTDMFEFFRSPTGRINPQYWAEKLTDSRDRAKRYDPDIFTARVIEEFVTAARDGGVPAGTGRALRRDVLDPDICDSEDWAHKALMDFEHRGFQFTDTWEWDFKDYDWWFLWALHGIVWGIAQYDAHKALAARGVVDVHLPAVAS